MAGDVQNRLISEITQKNFMLFLLLFSNEHKQYPFILHYMWIIVVNMNIADLYPLLGAASWAVSSAIIRKLEEFGSPAQLNFIRTSIGAVLFILHVIIIGKLESLFDISLLILFYLVLSVLFNVALGDTLYFASQNRVGIKISTPIVNTYPLITIVLAVVLLDEIVNLQLVLGSIIIIFGIISLSIDRDVDSTHRIIEWRTGLVYALLATFLYALGIIFTTIGTEGLDPIAANSIRLPSGALLLLVIVILQNQSRSDNSSQISLNELIKNTRRSTKLQMWGLVISGVLGTYVSSLFLVLSVQTIGASRTSILFSVGPFFSLPLAIFWLKERVGVLTFFGTILTVVGIWIILV